jgi:hypothetical protein
MQNSADRWGGSAGGKGGRGGGEESHRSAVGSGVLSVTHGLSTRGNKNVDECGVVNMCAKELCGVVTNWIICAIEIVNMRLIMGMKLQILIIDKVDSWCDEEKNGRRDDVSDAFSFICNVCK